MGDPIRPGGRVGMTLVAVVALVGGWFALTIRDGEALAPTAPTPPDLEPLPTLEPIPDTRPAPVRRPRPVATTRSSR